MKKFARISFSLFVMKKARAVGRNVGNFNLFIKAGIMRSVVPACKSQLRSSLSTFMQYFKIIMEVGDDQLTEQSLAAVNYTDHKLQ